MSVYLDKHTTDQSMAHLSTQGGLNNSVLLSEFEKGLKELGMEALHTNSLQAKDRLKWFFRTPQDQLVKEKRLRGVRTIEEGIWFLEASLPLHNKMSLACPGGEDKLHRPLTKGMDLETTYNAICVHSELGYISPEEFEEFYWTGGRFPSKRQLQGDTEIWVGLRKSIVGQMVRSFFTG